MRHKIRCLLSALTIVALCHGALAQPGSEGGSIGNSEKSLSGTRSAEPVVPPKKRGSPPA